MSYVKSDRRSPAADVGSGLVVKLVPIGNSRGVRIPKAVIEQAGLSDELEMTVRRGEIVLQSRRKRRTGWAESIKAAVANVGHDVDEDFLGLPNDFSEEEWTWPRKSSTSTSSHSIRRRARK